MKATAQAPSNIAFVKYWGKSNNALTLPNNNSLSMNLESLHTITTVEFDEMYSEDLVEIGFFQESIQKVSGGKKQRVIDQLNRLRQLKNITTRCRVRSINNFPADAGIASSASAFAALTAAACAALQLKPSLKELSILTRLGGSGSAARSVPDGFTEWKRGKNSNGSYAVELAPPSHWDLVDIVLIVSQAEKSASSLEGHESAETSPYYPARLHELKQRVVRVRKAIMAKDFHTLGQEIEKDALSLHLTALTSVPPIWYWQPETIALIHEVYALRRQGIEAYFTIDAGPNVHVICEQKNAQKIRKHFASQAYISKIFSSGVGKGAQIISKHLF